MDFDTDFYVNRNQTEIKICN